MLGQARRTTRADVGLALAMAGIAYLVWTLAIGVARGTVNDLSSIAHAQAAGYPTVTEWLCGAFLNAAGVWDLLGVLWLLVSLVLIVGSGRQRWIISWAWLSAICHGLAAALMAVWAALAAIAPFRASVPPQAPPAPSVGWGAFSVAIAIALIMWVAALVWMLAERARLRRGPSLRDGLRTHISG